jgi:hypothetical protein
MWVSGPLYIDLNAFSSRPARQIASAHVNYQLFFNNLLKFSLKKQVSAVIERASTQLLCKELNVSG